MGAECTRDCQRRRELYQYDQIYNQAIKDSKGHAFVDVNFPPLYESLIPHRSAYDRQAQVMAKKWRNYQFIRLSELNYLGEIRLFLDPIGPHSIRQGVLGNCYFLSVLSTLSMSPRSIKKIFISDSISEAGIYVLTFYKSGKREKIIIDDYMPCNEKGILAFSQATSAHFNNHQSFRQEGNLDLDLFLIPERDRLQNEVWVMLLEKAWAKVHGSYERITSGQSYVCMRDLTGAPSFVFETSDSDVFQRILEGVNRGFCMTADVQIGKENDGSESLLECGLINNHSYGIMSAAQFRDRRGRLVQLVKLRNPWGNQEWNGAWSDNSPLWTPQLKRKYNQGKVENDGTFWMSLDDMLVYFKKVHQCQLTEGHQFSSYEVHSYRNNFHVISFQVSLRGSYTFSLSQKCKMLFPKDSGYQYSRSKVIILKSSGWMGVKNGVKYVKGKRGEIERDTYIQIDGMEVGTYLALIEVDWLDNMGVNTFCLTSYGPAPINFLRDDSNSFTKSDLLHLSFASRVQLGIGNIKQSDCYDQGAPNIKKYTCEDVDEDGYLYFMVQNGEREAVYREIVEFTELQNCVLVEPEWGNKYEMEVGPGQTKMVAINTLPVKSGSFSYRYASKVMVQLGDTQLIQNCLRTGKQDVREQTPGVKVYSMKHSSGMIYVYQNDNQMYTLQEEIEIIKLQGLQIVGYEGLRRIEFEVRPGEQKVLKIERDLYFNGNTEYQIRTRYRFI